VLGTQAGTVVRAHIAGVENGELTGILTKNA